MYMTEFASPETERRGIATNSFGHAALGYLNHQMSVEGKKQNEFIMKPKLFKELYTETDGILPSVKYCLAPRSGRPGRFCVGSELDQLLDDERETLRSARRRGMGIQLDSYGAQAHRCSLCISCRLCP